MAPVEASPLAKLFGPNGFSNEQQPARCRHWLAGATGNSLSFLCCLLSGTCGVARYLSFADRAALGLEWTLFCAPPVHNLIFTSCHCDGCSASKTALHIALGSENSFNLFQTWTLQQLGLKPDEGADTRAAVDPFMNLPQVMREALRMDITGGSLQMADTRPYRLQPGGTLEVPGASSTVTRIGPNDGIVLGRGVTHLVAKCTVKDTRETRADGPLLGVAVDSFVIGHNLEESRAAFTKYQRHTAEVQRRSCTIGAQTKTTNAAGANAIPCYLFPLGSLLLRMAQGADVLPSKLHRVEVSHFAAALPFIRASIALDRQAVEEVDLPMEAKPTRLVRLHCLCAVPPSTMLLFAHFCCIRVSFCRAMRMRVLRSVPAVVSLSSTPSSSAQMTIAYPAACAPSTTEKPCSCAHTPPSATQTNCRSTWMQTWLACASALSNWTWLQRDPLWRTLLPLMCSSSDSITRGTHLASSSAPHTSPAGAASHMLQLPRLPAALLHRHRLQQLLLPPPLQVQPRGGQRLLLHNGLRSLERIVVISLLLPLPHPPLPLLAGPSKYQSRNRFLPRCGLLPKEPREDAKMHRYCALCMSMRSLQLPSSKEVASTSSCRMDASNNSSWTSVSIRTQPQAAGMSTLQPLTRLSCAFLFL